MIGASRDSLATCVEALDTRRGAADFASVGEDLFAVAALLGQQTQLRSTLADAGQSESTRRGLVEQLLGGKIGATSLAMVATAVGQRWSEDEDLVLALEQLADQAVFTVAQDDGSLDATEEEIFRFGRAVQASPELQMALTDPAQSAATKAAIVTDLLGSRATAATVTVIKYAVGHLHGRRIDSVLDHLCDLAAAQRERVVAQVRVARPLEADQARRLAAALSALQGRTVRLNVAVDPDVLGGVHVTLGDEVIDGTIASRLEQARRAVLG